MNDVGRTLLAIALLLSGCSGAVGDAVTIPIPPACAEATGDVDALVEDALDAIRSTTGRDALKASLRELAERYDKPTIECAVDAYSLARGTRLTDDERFVIRLAREYLEE